MKWLCSILSIAIVACADQKATLQKHDQEWRSNFNAQYEKDLKQLRTLEEYNSPTKKTAEDDAEAHRLGKIYTDGVMQSIITLDDGTSDAVTVARAAISENREALILWKRALMIHWYRKPHFRAQIDSKLMREPTENQINEAVSMVLQIRKEKKAEPR
jgi:hypothetical protein